MFEFTIPYSYILMFSGFLNGITAVIAFLSRTRRGAFTLGMLMTGVTLWSVFYAAELLSTNLGQMIFWAKIEYIWIVSIPPAWLYFAFSLHPSEKLRNKRNVFLLLIIPVFILLAIWTNQYHHLFWTQNELHSAQGMFFMKNSYGPFFWAHFIYSYILILVGTVLLIYHFIITDPITRYRFIYWLLPLFPLLGNLVSIIKLTPFQYLDLTPLGFTVSGLILFWGGTRRFQLELIPIAQEVVMDNIEDGLIITDHQGKVIDFNPAASRITGLKTNHQIQAFLDNGFLDRIRNSRSTQFELNGAFHCPHVLMRITSIPGRRGHAGWVLMLTDITGQKEAAREFQESKERYETIFRGMRDAIFVRSYTGEIMDANPAACEMYGFTREELVGKTVLDLMSEDAALLITAENVDRGMIFESPDHLLQTINYRVNGEMFPVEIRECPVIISGDTVFLIVVRDVSEKVEAETALKAMNETLEQRIRERTEELRLAYDATIEGWARALELREKETAGHSERTVAMALKFAQKVGIEGEQLEHIRRGALLHDIGKMVVPDHILQKPGSLTQEEQKIIFEHPVHSMKMLGHIDFLKPAVVIPYYHHEKWDGSGYPAGLKGEEIPLEARLFALVDVWDALCSDRPYRKALGPDQALAIIEKEIGSHFDPAIGQVFVEMMREKEVLTLTP